MVLQLTGDVYAADQLLRAIGLWWNGAVFWGPENEPISIRWSTPPTLEDLVDGASYIDLDSRSATFTRARATLEEAGAFDDDHRDQEGVLIGSRFVKWAPTQDALYYINDYGNADVDDVVDNNPLTYHKNFIPRQYPFDDSGRRKFVLLGDKGSLTHRTMVATYTNSAISDRQIASFKLHPTPDSAGEPDLLAELVGGETLAFEMMTTRTMSTRYLRKKWQMIEDGEYDRYRIVGESRAHVNKVLSQMTADDEISLQIKNFPRTPGNYSALSLEKTNEYIRKSRSTPGCYVGRLVKVESYQPTLQKANRDYENFNKYWKTYDYNSRVTLGGYMED